MESARVGDQPRILSDHLDDGAFTSELCKVLTNLATTPGGEFSDLAMDLARLREALLHEVETETVSTSRSSRRSESEGATTV